MVPTTWPEQSPEWSHENLTNPTAVPVLEWIATHGDAELTGAMVVKEFLGKRITPLQAHSRPLCEYTVARDVMKLHTASLKSDELSGALTTLLNLDPEDPP
ncbi:hypothetical protein D1007_37400 [Hordeum vulgare]|nr:hypothetical protein D1007_37400 [Hordeum vulgare]